MIHLWSKELLSNHISGYEPRDFPCDGRFPCGNCKLQEEKVLYLKGICAHDIENTYDNQYYVYGIRDETPYFRYSTFYNGVYLRINKTLFM